MRPDNEAIRILLVDDNREAAELVATFLRRQGYTCLVESSSLVALKCLDEFHADLAIIDIMMPGIGGVELLKRIRMLYPSVAVIMLTGLVEVQTATKCLRLGAVDYLSKPINFKALSVSVHRALEKRNLITRRQDFQRYLEEEVARKTNEIQVLFLSTIEALVNALEAKDSYTEGHSRRVTLHSLLLTYELGLEAEFRETIRLAGLLHDIGKIGIPEAILNKPDRLLPAEFELIKKHPVIGESILKSIPQLRDIPKAIRHHHERYDGTGYPDRLKGEDIPLISRILAVADTYDSITTDRPYRKAPGRDFALCELSRCRGTQFDPIIADAFLNMRIGTDDLDQLIKFSEDPAIYKNLFLEGNLDHE